MRRNRLILSAFLILLCTAAQASTTVENIRLWAEGGKTRVVLDLSRPVEHTIFTLRGPDRHVRNGQAGAEERHRARRRIRESVRKQIQEPAKVTGAC